MITSYNILSIGFIRITPDSYKNKNWKMYRQDMEIYFYVYYIMCISSVCSIYIITT